MRKSFVLHIDSLCVLDDLSDEQKGQLFYAIYQYQLGNEINVSPIVKIAFSQFKNQFNRDDEKYATLCEKNRQIALNRNSKQDVTKSTKRNEASPSVTKSTDNKNKSDSKSDSDSNSNKEKKDKSFSFNLSQSYAFASLSAQYKDKLYAYALVKDGATEYQRFEDFHAGKGNKFKDWSRSYNTWLGNKKERGGNIFPPEVVAIDIEGKMTDCIIDGERALIISTLEYIDIQISHTYQDEDETYESEYTSSVDVSSMLGGTFQRIQA